MASTFTANLNLELQGTGDNSGTWGGVLNSNVFQIIDNVLGGVQTLSLSNSNVALNTTQGQNNFIKLTGTLLGNVDVTFPAIGRTYFVLNNTTGNFTVTLKCAGGGTSAVIPQGRGGFIVLDAVNVTLDTAPQLPAGAVTAFAMSTVPTGWLECDGSAISRTTYLALFRAIGTTYGAGDGSTTFNVPDLRGIFIRGWSHGASVDSGRAIGTLQQDDFESHTHVFAGDALGTHAHTFPTYNTQFDTANTIKAGSGVANGTATSSAVSAGTPSGTNQNTGGTETRPVNLALMYCIKT